MHRPLCFSTRCVPILGYALAIASVGCGLLTSPILAAQDRVSVAQMLQAAQRTAGLCAHLGCGNGALTIQLAAGGKLLVHALEADAAQVQIARQVLTARGLYGVATVEPWTADTLPYADNLINVLVAENPGTVTTNEILRVLVPNGIAWLRQGEAWTRLRKLWPPAFDDWTHWRHGADGNMVSRDLAVGIPKSLRWVAGPAQDAYGKRWYYDHVLVSADGRNFYTYENQIVARDAFNGSLLWQRSIKAYVFRETGTAVPAFLQAKAKLGSRTSKVRPVAVGDRLVVAAEGKLLILDATTGATAAEITRVNQPRELLVADNMLVVSEREQLRAFYLPSATLQWTSALTAKRMVAGDGHLFCLSSNRVVSLDLATGRQQWQTVEDRVLPATTMTYGLGVLALEKSTWRNDPEGCGVLVFSGDNGRLLWLKDYPTDMTHFQEARAFIAQDLLWLQMGKNQIIGHDPWTGHPRKTWQSRGKHCATPVATERFFIAPECDFTDLATGARQQARMFKSACRLPFIPANGLLYSFPVQCECYPMLRGYMGLAPTDTRPVRTNPRLVRGPAFGRHARRSTPDRADEWPMYRHDTFRSGSTPAPLNVAHPTPRWATRIKRPRETQLAAAWRDDPFVPNQLTPPVIAGDQVLVAVPNAHRLVALDASTGKRRWTFIAGGRIDLPPTVANGLCLFGAHDGWVYGLNAARGELAWRFRAAPGEARIPAYGQMESPWPVPGSILVDDGIAYFAAGRHPRCDGGVRVFALEVNTGRVVWEKNLNTLELQGWYSPLLPRKNNEKPRKVGLDFEPFDLLVKDGDFVAMSRWRFRPANGDVQLDWASLDYETPNLAVPRGLWGYGIRQTKAVQRKLPAIFNATGVRVGEPGDVALLLAGDTLVRATATRELHVGDTQLQLPAPAVRDGLAVAYHRLFVSLANGQVLCFQ